MQWAVERAQERIAGHGVVAVALGGAQNVGRLAAYVIRAAEQGLLTPLMASAPGNTAAHLGMFRQLDADEVYRIVRPIKPSAVSNVESMGGMVNQIVGDKIVGLFGIEGSGLNNAVGAVAAALEIHSVVREALAGIVN